MDKFTIASSDLKNVLKKAGSVVNANALTGNLSSILMTVSPETLTAKGTNLETTISMQVPCISMSSFEFLITLVDLAKLCKELPVAPMDIIRDDSGSSISITCGKSSWIMSIVSDVDFPKISYDGFTESFQIGLDSGIAIQTARKFISKDTLRPAMCGVCMVFENGTLKCVSTDAHNLYCSNPFLVSHQDNDVFVIPKSGAEALSIFDNLTSLELSFNTNHACFKVDTTLVYTRLVDQKFPPWQSVVPKDNANHMTFEVSELMQAVKMASIASSDTDHAVELKISDGDLDVVATDLDWGRKGKSSATPVEKVGDNTCIGLNAEMLLNILKCLTGQIKVEYNSAHRAVIFREVGEQEFYLLMPLMLAENV